MTVKQNLKQLRQLLARARNSEAHYDHANGDDARRIANIYRDDIEALTWAIGLAEEAGSAKMAQDERARSC